MKLSLPCCTWCRSGGVLLAGGREQVCVPRYQLPWRFDYFFIPPFYTFAVGRLEGWLVLAIFLVVSIVVIGRIQSGLTKAQNQ